MNNSVVTNLPPLVRLLEQVDYCLFLIREELKTRHFFNGLHAAGVEDVSFRPNLDLLILRHVGLDDSTNETFSFYTDIMDKRSRKIGSDNDSHMAQALKVYVQLVGEKWKRKHGN